MSSNHLIPNFIDVFTAHWIDKASFARGSLGFLDLNGLIPSF
jgi:hypothetical protein